MKKINLLIKIVFFLFITFNISYTKEVQITTLDTQTIILEKTEKIMSEAYKQLELTMKIKKFPARRSLKIANSGQVDGELYRVKDIDKSYPNLIIVPVSIISLEFVAFSKNEKIDIKGWESLLPYHVVYMRGVKAIEDRMPDNIFSDAVKTTKQAFLMLNLGRSDILIAPRQRALVTLKELGLKDIKLLEPPLMTLPLFHYLHKKNRHLVEPLTQILLKMKDNGTIESIIKQIDQKWFGKSKL
ncbi:substrate-binding periplasmic protein [Sulfurospirillum arcachonense]|uniref:substrate-binding periplasmic protein n=1 Tax=Sulfurospirillum arcachonense TaxID=57666 RepID=UPI0004681AC4|nr:transporter substrate-binding domain-containing protein [Sulfurospirillum arcachonense]